jgi:hypothetical protein
LASKIRGTFVLMSAIDQRSFSCTLLL